MVPAAFGKPNLRHIFKTFLRPRIENLRPGLPGRHPLDQRKYET
jgi:hypothetical protein